MAKNILIFSDGTGQAGGLLPDERRSNVYKLYRATRCGPDSNIDPSKQFAFYDAGLGSAADASHIKVKWWRKIYNLLSQATGLGVTQNIIDCYAAIIQVWEPGDRIYLFGFSRGAYTARCVGGVLSYCGVPTEFKSKPVKRDLASCRAIAAEAVKGVYQHGSGHPTGRFASQRAELAVNFKQKYSSGTQESSNTIPYFIGVWDTVAALGASKPRLLVFWVFTILVLWAFLEIIWKLNWRRPYIPADHHWWIFGGLLVFGAVAGAVYLYAHMRFTTKTSYAWWRTFHRKPLKLKFYDLKLDQRVSYAKHALSIDENRRDFKEVLWDQQSEGKVAKTKDWLEQVWFAGVHSDVGGSYPETEARLSDITLAWMLEKVEQAEYPVLIDMRFLNLYPQPDGMQHDERKSSRIPWAFGSRAVPDDAILHESVAERLRRKAVLHYDEMEPYRPGNLRHHSKTTGLY